MFSSMAVLLSSSPSTTQATELSSRLAVYFQLEMSLPSFLCNSAPSPLNWLPTIHCRLPSPLTTALQVRTTSSLGRSTEPGLTPKTTGGPRGWLELVVVVVVEV